MPESEDAQVRAEVTRRFATIAHLRGASSLLSWDQMTKLPPGGREARGAQAAALEGVIHERLVDPALTEVVERLAETLEGDDAFMHDYVRQAREDIRQATAVPADLVEALALTTSRANAAWVEAREASDFAAFAPVLREVVDLNRQRADALGWSEHRYDALHQLFEPGSSTQRVRALFARLKEALPSLIQDGPDGTQADDEPARRYVSAAEQERIVRDLTASLGYDYSCGRLDETVHPFAQAIGLGDVRITTRYAEARWPTAFFGGVHEAGHAMYEQGIPAELYGTPLGRYASLAVHESQSRLWENHVARSQPFWEGYLPQFSDAMGGRFADLDASAMARAVNRVEPSFIRIEADQVTYPLHVILRFELEVQLIEGSLDVDDLQDAWNEGMQELLGITPPSDALGVLQDVHWSIGAIGYFPTYALGSMMAAQLWERIEADLPDVQDQMRTGRFDELLGWLQRQVHAFGRRKLPDDVMVAATGRPLDPEPYVRHLTHVAHGDLGRRLTS
jgi:carboxypeptidase Taq